MGATLDNVARRANVSSMTASLALNGESGRRVSSATRDWVRQAARQVGYVSNLAAQALATVRTRTIALWVRAGGTWPVPFILHDSMGFWF